jgi:sigma-B regulation protein RsbU (phosphoserine phosphatase)
MIATLLIITSIIFIAFTIVLILFINLKQNKIKDKKQDNQKAEKLENNISILDEKNNDFTSSIKYAKRLVDAILKIGDSVKFNKLEYFLFLKPRDIISGDFVWSNSKYDRHYFVVADCTGHGVPGAFISIISYNLLNQAINEFGIIKPSEILEFINKRHYEIFNKDNKSHIHDGMELAICVIDTDSELIEYSGAMRPLYIVSANGEIEKNKGDRISIGEATDYTSDVGFKDHVLEFSSGDTLYMTSDGFVDQFGGENNKKYKNQRFNELLQKISKSSMEDQKKLMDKELKDWMGSTDQIDDIAVLGIRMK